MSDSRGWRTINGRRYAQVRARGGQRFSIPLSGCDTDDEADDRFAMIHDVAGNLADAGHLDLVKVIGDSLGKARSAKDVALARKAAEKAIAQGKIAPRSQTFQQFAERWTSGELHRDFPDYVKEVSQRENIGRLSKHVYPIIGPVPMANLTLEDAELVMRRLDPGLSAGSRRMVAQAIYRVTRLAVYPVKILKATPLPVGFLPKIGSAKAKPYLYPDEDAKLLGCRDIALERRLVYGILAREGMRSSELIGRANEPNRPGVDPVAWGTIDLKRGLFTLDKNKTNAPRAWVMDPGVTRSLKVWQAMQGNPSASRAIFDPIPKLAQALRDDFLVAGVDREELRQRSASRAWMKAHHLRGTFVTLSLANGKTETWVQDRTGHTSTLMINGYRRAARTAAELDLGELRPLDVAIPELAEWVVKHPVKETTAEALNKQGEQNESEA